MRRLAGVLVLLVSGLIASACPGQSEPIPDASPAAGPDLRVGAVFLGNSLVHGCSGAVLDSTSGDLIITAAHCMAGPGSFISFSPGYDKGTDPKGMWNVAQIYLDPRWVADQDVDRDYAVLRVTPGYGAPNTTIENAVGGGLHVTKNPVPGEQVTVTGYGVGLFDSPTVCTRPTGIDNGYPTFTCDGFRYGTSGGPWVSHGTDLVGIIGGPHQGGCTNGVSYTPLFDSPLYEVIRRAETRAPGDNAPIPNVLGDC